MLRRLHTAQGPILILSTLLILAAIPVDQTLAVQEATLEQRLKAGLKARTKAEFAFLDLVVDRVEEGVLPQLLVDRVFFWARRKARSKKIGSKTRRPMVYFQPALVILAARMKIPL